MDTQSKLDQWFQEQGRALEAAMSEAGSPLPAGISGELMVRGLLQEAERRVRSPEGQARVKQMAAIVKQVAAELPGGHKDPDFPERVQARMRELLEPEEDGPNASA